MTTINDVRAAIQAALPPDASAEAGSLRAEDIYFPASHKNALRLESSLIIGGRGVGKTFWTKVLSASDLRETLVQWVPDLQNVDVHLGFSANENLNNFPVERVFVQLLNAGFDTEIIWTAVLMRWLAPLAEEPIPMGSWTDTAAWVQQEPEKEARILQGANEALQQRGKRGLIVFDALDQTTPNDWDTMNKLVRGLLKVVLRLTRTSCIFGKIFLREDQYTASVVDFPDSSKLQATRCDLAWFLHELHGLLWHTLCNAPPESGVLLRGIYEKHEGVLETKGGVYCISLAVTMSEERQKKLFHALAGPKMGKDTKRGVPYLWTVSHLADSRQRTSPRSFLVALKKAATDSERYAAQGYEYPLHYESIKRGVQAASQVRVAEMKEDYPWVESLFNPLERQFNVPVESSVIIGLWQEAFPTGMGKWIKQPPQMRHGDWDGVLKQLEHMGMCSTMRDKRINMPDLYRVAFNIGRKGGVKPVANS